MMTTNELPSPVPAAAPAPAPAVKKKKVKARRIGTFTMGLCLILGGILLCAFLIRPSQALLRILEFSPLVLVMLGVELLLSHFRFPHQKLRYDFLSIVVCTIVLLVGLTGSAVGAWSKFIVQAPITAQTWRDELRSDCAQLLSDEPVASVDLFFEHGWSLDNYLKLSQMSKAELAGSSELNISIHLSGSYDDADDFAREVKGIIRSLHNGKIHPGHLYLLGKSPYDNQNFRLELDGLFAHQLSVSELREMAMDTIKLPPDESLSE